MSEMSMRQDLLRDGGGGVRREMSTANYIKLNWILYVMLIPGLINLILFKYMPMYGIVVAFQDYTPKGGFLHSTFVGLKHFHKFFRDPFCWRVISNTFILGIESLIFSFPAPIILALLLNELNYPRFKKITQTISYMPHFLSVVIVVGMMKELFSMTDGPINAILEMLGFERQNFFMMPSAFRPLYIGSGIWQGVGYGSIIYLAAIAGINIEMYESAVLDGANRMQQIWYITLPSILPTVTILFIMAVGGILGNDYQKILLMYSPRTYATADVISTYVYRYGIETAGNNLSYSSAVGLLTNVASLIFLVLTNWITGKLSDTSLF
ncbi:MAG: ABC transporter permease [Christensenellales bacterium]|jgi:putative aldouronate transport system permease protein